MSDIKTSVLTVDTGNAITNVKDFKQHIEDLKGVLLGLEKGTEDYNTVAKELRNSQEKLNEVMDVAKGRGEAVEGSYDNLVATMRELKKQWRATGDEIERQKLGEKILDINNQLKELDASTGNYQRNVGDYQNAFEKAFDATLKGIGANNGELGRLMGNIKNLIPLIKAVNTTALTGLSGIKKAIASTGIGLLVVAVGELAAHWKDVTNWIGKAIGLQDNYTDSVEASKQKMDALKGSIEDANKQLEYQSRLMAARGDSQKDILNTEKQSIEGTIENLRDERNAVDRWLRLYGDAWNKLGREERKTVEAKKKQKKDYDDLIADEEKKLKKIEEELAILDASEKKAAKDISDAARFALLSREEQLKETYEKQKALLEEQGIDTTNLYNKYLKDLADLRKSYEPKVSLTDVIFNTNNGDYEKIKAQIEKYLSDVSKSKEQALEDDYNLNKQTLVTAENDEYQQIENIYNKRKAELDKYLKEGKISRKDYNSAIEKMDADVNTARISIAEKYNKTRIQLDEKYLADVKTLTIQNAKETADATIVALNNEYNKKKINLDYQFKLEGLNSDESGMFSTKDIETAYQRVVNYNNAVLALITEKNEGIIKENEKLLETLAEGSEERLEAEKAIVEARMEIQNAETENIIANADAQEEREKELAEKRKERLQLYVDGLGTVSSMLDTFAKSQEEQIKDDVENGRITEKEAKKRFETVKKMQIASAIVNMAAGVVSAIASAQELGPIAGPIMAALNSAAVIAAGTAQIASIKRTKFGSTSTQDTTTTPDTNQVVNEFNPQYTQNITTDTELSELANAVNSRPLYVSVTDIDAVQQTVTTRENECSF